LQARDDGRRVRFARVDVLAVGGGDAELTLVTDARGRLRYPLTAGEYELRVDEGVATRFLVGERGWTAVRVRLP
jgi:hypothetical protein